MGYSNNDNLLLRCQRLEAEISAFKNEAAERVKKAIALNQRVNNLDYTVKAMLSTIPSMKFSAELTNFAPILRYGTIEINGHLDGAVFKCDAALELPDGVTLQVTDKDGNGKE